jgi:phenylacetate-CoA ligase
VALELNMARWLSPIAAYKDTMGAQWQPRQVFDSITSRRLSAVLHAAYQTPYYKALFQQAEIGPGDISTVFDLAKFPVSTKSDFQNHALIDRLAGDNKPERLKSESSSGSTGTPFTVYFDDDYYRIRSLVFLRALRAVGYRPGQRLLLVAQARPGRKNRRWFNWRYASIEDPPEVLAKIYAQFRPQVLYGCTTTLRLLAEYWSSAQSVTWAPKAVISTGEGIDDTTRRLLETTFKARVYDFYGLSEIGLVAWQCPTSGSYHVAEDLVLVETLPIAKEQQLARLVLTNLAQRVMPFIRYDTGDLCVSQAEQCACGRTFSLIRRFEGRQIDCVVLSDGTKVSPYRLTCAFEKLEDVTRFQICQEDSTHFTLLLETTAEEKTNLVKRATNCLSDVLSTELKISVQTVPKLEQRLGQKFRVVESKLGRHRPKERAS